MKKATQFCVNLENKPGTLAKLCSALRKAKVNIDAIAVSDNTECNWVRMVASPAAKAKRALGRGRFQFSTRPVLSVQVPNRPGELEQLASRLGSAGVNMNYVYCTGGDGANATVIISTNDTDKAKRAIAR